jgi:hypothetical protein
MPNALAAGLTPALQALVSRIAPGHVLCCVRPFGVDDSKEPDLATHKGIGYGRPLRLDTRDQDGHEHSFVFHTASPDQFGHDRRADRAAEMLLSFDRFARIPRHVPALDVGAVSRDRAALVSLADAGEFYLLTEFVPGELYADQLRRIAHRGRSDVSDHSLVERLAGLLLEIHAEKYESKVRYQRSVRDVLGSGEGLFGLVDAYAPDVPFAPPARLHAIEALALAQRWKLRGRESRLCRTHGDFHPFNIVITPEGELRLLDSSRGSAGDPADDVTCLAVNFVFFALEHPGTWEGAFRELWRSFWRTYLDQSQDRELLDVCALFLAWRGLVVANPLWYPAVSPDARDRILLLIELALTHERFDPALADEVFA